MSIKYKTKINAYFLDCVEDARGLVWRRVIEELMEAGVLNYGIIYPYCASRFVGNYYAECVGECVVLKDIIEAMAERFEIPIISARNYYYSLHNKYNPLDKILQLK